jgi:mannose-1-phosphate guanylyltransferase
MSLCYLLAAGLGTRLKPFTDFYAKPTIPFVNLPLAHYGFYLAHKGGFRHFLMNKHHLPDQIDFLAQRLSPFASEVQTVDETRGLLGSGGALWNARDILMKHPFFLVANADEILIPQRDDILNSLVDHFNKTEALGCLLTCDHPELLKSLKAVWCDPDSNVHGFGMESPQGGLTPAHYTGYKVFSNKILDWLPDGESNIFYDVVVEALAQGQRVTHLHMSQALWYEVGNPHSFFKAARDITLNHHEALTKRRSFFGFPPLQKVVDANKAVFYENKEQMLSTNQCEGFVILGQKAKIKKKTLVRNQLIFPHQVYDGSHDPKVSLGLEENS